MHAHQAPLGRHRHRRRRDPERQDNREDEHNHANTNKYLPWSNGGVRYNKENQTPSCGKYKTEENHIRHREWDHLSGRILLQRDQPDTHNAGDEIVENDIGGDGS